MLSLWLVLLLVLALVLPVFAPSDIYGVEHIGAIATALVLPASVAGFAAYRWVGRVSRERCTVRGEIDQTLSPIVADFRIRSGMYRLAAIAVFVFLIGVTAAGFFLLSEPARQRAVYEQRVPGDPPALLAPLIETEERREALADPEVAAVLTAILNRTRSPSWGEVAGAAALWLVALHVIATLLRRMMRLASFYDSRADYLQMGGAPGTEDRRHLLEFVDAGSAVPPGWIWQMFGRRDDGPSVGEDRR